jgi:hypothetical protein
MSFRRTENPTYEQVAEALSYDPETGIFRWLRHQGTKAKGSIAGGVGKKGYLYIRIFRHKYGNNQLAWLFMTKAWQPLGSVVDHKNRDILDNRAENLRLATMAENQRNSDKRPLRGVNLQRDGKWRSLIVHNGRHLHLGTYPTKQLAIQTRDCVSRILHGEFYLPSRDVS